MTATELKSNLVRVSEGQLTVEALAQQISASQFEKLDARIPELSEAYRGPSIPYAQAIALGFQAHRAGVALMGLQSLGAVIGLPEAIQQHPAVQQFMREIADASNQIAKIQSSGLLV